MKYYVMNSAVITAPGKYYYRLISPEHAKRWLEEHHGEFESIIAYEDTAAALEQLTGIKVDVKREQIRMKKGDEALIFRLTKRIPPDQKGRVSTHFILSHCEIGLLRRI